MIRIAKSPRKDMSHPSESSEAPVEPPAPILHLEKGLIRPFCRDDADALAREANNLEIAKWMRNAFPHPYRFEDAIYWISSTTTASPICHFAICRIDDNTVIGGIGLKPRDDIHYRSMEVGYWLGEKHWHQGIATEAVFKFCDHTFERFKHVLRLEAEVFEGNNASARVLEKTGFIFESRRSKAIEKDGVVMDVWMYCKLRQ